MDKNDNKMNTKDLIQSLSESKYIDDFLQRNESELNNISIDNYLYQLIEKAGLTIPQIMDKASIGKSLAYQIFNGKRSPNRNILIRLALILKLDFDETQRLLRIAKKGELYPRIQRDAAIIYCIQHGYSLCDTNELLENLGEAILLKEE